MRIFSTQSGITRLVNEVANFVDERLLAGESQKTMIQGDHSSEILYIPTLALMGDANFIGCTADCTYEGILSKMRMSNGRLCLLYDELGSLSCPGEAYEETALLCIIHWKNTHKKG